MNRKVEAKKVTGKGLVYTNPCPKSSNESDLRVGNPRYCNGECCEFFKKVVNHRDGTKSIHCEYINKSWVQG